MLFVLFQIIQNQIPGKSESTKGNYARGIYWTKPDHSGKESVRDKTLDETLFTEFVKDYWPAVCKEAGLTDLQMRQLTNTAVLNPYIFQ